MKAKEVRNLSEQEIEKQLRDTSSELLHLRLRKQSGQVETPSELRVLRRNIARMETILKERAVAAAK
ncbi:MAG: 50S ribosomal protein L29 [Verrucomicrobia bacterium]|nr:50S ribosomal protein L29 [Verrucomicrobiota bacterium]MDA1064939.1 50S ribosomal protein L29 [Verrucomicrobiota bacterium]